MVITIAIFDWVKLNFGSVFPGVTVVAYSIAIYT